ncbi:hypothetical protein M569_04110 [Genlisea aurea]|uniref:Uncharacterized protein n=1 Tax=Genlisea aurea TaxID=192259 RepID=S8E4G3_9LAMI|nr:hypothetical protein M569_04110 [Genlisea aurea]
MEKTKKKKMVKFLSFQNLLLPDVNHHHQRSKPYFAKGFSGPIIPSVVPADALRKTRNAVPSDLEPTSPKVSCVGRIKCPAVRNKDSDRKEHKKKKEDNKKKGSSSEAIDDRRAAPPRLGELRKFASNRETLDWRATDGEDAVSIPFSAPMVVVGIQSLGSEAKKESVLWKRRAARR